MLILNNGVPKSGSTWVQKIIKKMLRPDSPSSEWRNSWANPSIEPERLKSFVSEVDWKSSNILIKMHFLRTREEDFLDMDGIRVIVSHRNLPDSVVSMYYHQKRLGKLGDEAKSAWFRNQGIKFGELAVAHRQSWEGSGNCLLMSYENMVSDAASGIMTLSAFLGRPLSIAKASRIAQDTQVRLDSNEAPRDGLHVRTAGRSQAREELPNDVYERLVEMEALGGRH